jgi:hypothetical protein
MRVLGPLDSGFSVKVPIVDGEHTEHFWRSKRGLPVRMVARTRTAPGRAFGAPSREPSVALEGLTIGSVSGGRRAHCNV